MWYWHLLSVSGDMIWDDTDADVSKIVMRWLKRWLELSYMMVMVTDLDDNTTDENGSYQFCGLIPGD